MNITFNSDRLTDVYMTFTFLDGRVYNSHIRLSGYGPGTHTVVGRSAEEIVRLELQYDGNRFGYPINVDEQGNMPVINIYGGRDQWSQLLREAAMKSAKRGTTPSDYDDPELDSGRT